MVTLVVLSMNPSERLLNSIAAQTYQNFEVIIAKEKGIVNAMNKALDRAIGDIFVRIDDDVELPNHWLESLVEGFSDATVAGVTGPTYVPISRRANRDSIRIAESPNWFFKWMFDNKPFAPAKIYKCGSVSYGSNYFDRMEQTKEHQIDHLEGTNWAMRTELIKLVGGFDPKFDGVCEWFDTDVEKKIVKLGYRLVYKQSAWLWHLLEKGEHHSERHAMTGRIKNWIRFHYRHSEFHPKMVIWLAIMVGYGICKRFR